MTSVTLPRPMPRPSIPVTSQRTRKVAAGYLRPCCTALSTIWRMTTIDTNQPLAVVRPLMDRFVGEVVNGFELDVLHELYTPDTLVHVPIRLGPVRGPSGYAKIIGAIQSGLPDLHVDIVEMVADRQANGDVLAMTCLDAKGTHDGEFFGVAPTGRKTKWTAIHKWRVRDGRVAADLVAADFLAVFIRLGVLKPPGLDPAAA